ncbi:unnamed protein product, partial [Protopolystoma xenopodis]
MLSCWPCSGVCENPPQSVPLHTGSTRNISASFLANNPAQRHRLIAFVRRELRALAPWLAYDTSAITHNSDQADHSLRRLHSGRNRPHNSSSSSSSSSSFTSTQNGSSSLNDPLHHFFSAPSSSTSNSIPATSPPSFSPLLFGAGGGLHANTPMLDDLSVRVVQHVSQASLTNWAGLFAYLRRQPGLNWRLVPLDRLMQFCAEFEAFARSSAPSLTEYDASVSLHRGMPLPLSHSAVARRPPPVYIGSSAAAGGNSQQAGFAPPHQLVVGRISTWLGTQLSVEMSPNGGHSASQDPLNMAADLTVRLLRAVGYPHTFRSTSSTTSTANHFEVIDLVGESTTDLHDSLTRGMSELVDYSGFEGDMIADSTAAGLSRLVSGSRHHHHPGRLLAQRLLSELIDQALFVAALTPYYQHNHNTCHSRQSLARIDAPGSARRPLDLTTRAPTDVSIVSYDDDDDEEDADEDTLIGENE